MDNDKIAEKVEEFFSRYKVRSYSKGQILLLNGEDTDYVYQLLKGTVKQYDVTYRGDEIILNIFKPPAFFPMSLAMNKVPNVYIYESETAIVIRQAPAQEAVEFIKANPDVLYDLLSRVYLGVDGLLGRITQLMSGSAKNRLLYELVVECRRFGNKKKDGSYELSATESNFGARAGLSRETVSRVMRGLKENNLAHLKGTYIVIPDINRVEQELKIDS